MTTNQQADQAPPWLWLLSSDMRLISLYLSQTGTLFPASHVMPRPLLDTDQVGSTLKPEDQSVTHHHHSLQLLKGQKQ